MGPDSQASMGDWGRIQSRFEFDEREENPPPFPPKGRANSHDIAGVGGRFADTSASDRQALDPSDLESMSEGPENDSNAGLSDSITAYSGPASFVGNPPSSSQPTTPRPQNGPPYSPGGPYLAPEYYRQYMENRNRRDRSRSSAQSSGEYLTAQGSPQTVTTVDEDGDENGEPIERVATPYFTPSHTPSHRSLTTEDWEEETHEGYSGRVPQSPTPWSQERSHQSHIAQRAVDAVDRRFTEIHNRVDRDIGHDPEGSQRS